MSRTFRHVFPAIVVLTFGVRLGALLLLRPAPVIDEPIHLAVAQQFGAGLPAIAQLRDYGSATGPFFYVLFGNLGALFGYNLTLLRLLVCVMAAVSLFLFHRVLKRLLPADDPLPALALLATAPYFLTLAGMFMTEHLAFVLGLASLLCYLRFRDRNRPSDAALSLLFATLAIYTRSYFIFLPVAFAAAGIIEHPRLWPRAMLMLLPVLAFLPMVLVWRGLAPPTYQHKYHLGLNWQDASSVFIWTGISFLPWVWHKPRPWYLVALLAVPIVLLAPLPGLGITHTALKMLPYPLALATAAAFGVVGLAYLVGLVPQAFGSESRVRVAAVGALLLAAGLALSGPAVYERYLLPGYPLMLICARPGTKPWLALAWAGLFQLPLAIIHILHVSG